MDVNGDGVINTSDYDYIGSAIPDITYGATLNMEYKGFDFTMFIQGQAGNDVLMGFIRTDRPSTNRLSLFYTDRWTPTHTNASRPAANVDTEYWNSDQMIFDGSYLKIKQIQLGYTLPKKVTDPLRIGRTRAYVSLDDFLRLLTIREWTLKQPVQITIVSVLTGGSSLFPKKVLFGLSLNF